MQAELTGGIGEVRMTIEVTRAATGKVEKYDIIGTVTDMVDNAIEINEEKDNGSNTFDSGA